MYCFKSALGRVAGAIVPCLGGNFGKRLGNADANFEIGHRAGLSFPDSTPELVRNSSKTLTDPRKRTDDDIKSCGDTIPIVAHLGVATGWNGWQPSSVHATWFGSRWRLAAVFFLEAADSMEVSAAAAV